MNKYLIITLCLLSSFFVFSQETDNEKSENVTFEIIEDAPIFPGCEDLDKKLQKKCLQNKIGKHVGKKFNTSLVNELDLKPGKTKLYVMFLIADDGIVKDVKARGAHEALEAEGIKVISSLPKMKPGLQKGEPVGVKYTLPITLRVDKKREEETIKN